MNRQDKVAEDWSYTRGMAEAMNLGCKKVQDWIDVSRQSPRSKQEVLADVQQLLDGVIEQVNNDNRFVDFAKKAVKNLRFEERGQLGNIMALTEISDDV